MRARAALLIVLLAAGCASRDRSNPFDPANQVTSGRPADFAAVAGNGRVALRWTATPASGLVGYQVFRRVGAQSEYVALSGVLARSSNAYFDYGLLNGVDHHYRLYFVFDTGLGQLPADDIATPGPVQPWVADFQRGAVEAVSADGREVAFRVPGTFNEPASVGVDSVRHKVWFSEFRGLTVRVYDLATGGLLMIPGLVSPGTLAVQPADGTAWICDEGADKVFHFASDGSPRIPIENVNDPFGVAVNRIDRSVWVCEWGANRVRHHSESASLLGSAAIDRPSRVALDAATGAAWVTSFSARSVHRIGIDHDVEQSLTSGFQGPIGIAVDDRRRRVWVADGLGNELIALDADDGSVEFRVPNLIGAYDVAVDFDTGEAWVVTATSSPSGEPIGQAVRVSPSGAVIQRLGGFRQPAGVAIRHDRIVVTQPQRTTATLAETARPSWSSRTR